MLGVEMYPSLPIGHQRLGDCFYRDRDIPSLYPSSCDGAARSLPPRLLAPPPAPVPAPNEAAPKPQDNIKMDLENASLWKQFSSIGTEMIITKKGRRMFPQLQVKVSGLNPTLRYILLLDIVPADSSRYRFQDDSWQVVGSAEARLPDRVFIHPDSPATGEHWQNRTISFHRTKLTNNTLDSQGYIILHSLHRYQPRLHVIEARDMLMWGGARHSFTFPETQFLTVTAYQNNRITELKINSNPFAKGFRENGMNSKRQREARQKRKPTTQQPDALDDLDIESCDPCDPCDSTELLPQQNPALSITSSALSINNPSCGFHGEAPPFPQSMASDQTFLSSQMTQIPDITDISTSMGSGLQTSSQDDLNGSLIDRSGQMIDLQSFSAPYADSSQFSSAPQTSSSYSSVSSTISSSGPPDPAPPASSSSSLPTSCYSALLSSSSLPSSTSSPPLQLAESSYPSVPPSSTSPLYPSIPPSSTSSLYPSIPPSSSSSSSIYSAQASNKNPDVLSPHSPNNSFTISSSSSTSSLPPPSFQSHHPSDSVHPMNPAQSEVAHMVPTHSSPPAVQNTAATAFPFPPLQLQVNQDPADPSTPHSLPHSTPPLSAFPFPDHQPPTSTSTPAPAPHPITPESVTDAPATAFPFPPASTPSSDPSPSHGHPTTAFHFPSVGQADSDLPSATVVPPVLDPTHSTPTSFPSAISSFPSSVSMATNLSAPSLSHSLPSAPAAVQSYSIPPTHSNHTHIPHTQPNHTHILPTHPNHTHIPPTHPNHTHNPVSSHPFASLPPSISSCPPMHPSLQNPTPGIHNPAQMQPGYPAPFPASSFPHIPGSASNPPQIPSCSAIPSQALPGLPLTSSAPAHHPSPSLGAASYPQYAPGAPSGGYPAVPTAEVGTFPSAQFNPAAPYLPEMVLHSSLLPSLDPSLPSSAPPALYPSFPSYPLRLCQDPRSSFHIPLRHIYRQPQHTHTHSQGSYLDMSGRPVF